MIEKHPLTKGKLDVAETWLYKRIIRISCIEYVTNTSFRISNKKLNFLGYITRKAGGVNSITGHIEMKRGTWKSFCGWMTDVKAGGLSNGETLL